MADKQNIVMVQNNNGGCGCGTLIGIIVLFGLVSTLLQRYGPIVTSVVGFFIGAWGGLKLSGVTIEELNAISEDEWGERQFRGGIFMLVSAVMLAIGGWHMGAELMKELNDNKEAVLRLLRVNQA